MAGRGCCVAAPKFIKSCSIRNESSGDVQIQVTYLKLGHESEDSTDNQYSIDLGQGETHKVAPRVVSDGGCEYNSQVHKIDVTLANGKHLSQEEPFDGVHSIQPDWLFAINDHGIKSLSPDS
ncbi:unnamed protein product [Rotaria sp. Silwood1]|nr:unnamed protein product [Rotaria sp. Silwood1]